MLDTRNKVVPAEEVPARLTGRTVVAAYFDPMVAPHTARFQALAEQYGPLAVCICDPPAALLPAQARAELAAACRSVEIVVIGDEHLHHAARIIDERDADLERRAALIEHVRSRQNG